MENPQFQDTPRFKLLFDLAFGNWVSGSPCRESESLPNSISIGMVSEEAWSRPFSSRRGGERPYTDAPASAGAGYTRGPAAYGAFGCRVVVPQMG